jgi:DNA transformation protein and related proteins
LRNKNRLFLSRQPSGVGLASATRAIYERSCLTWEIDMASNQDIVDYILEQIAQAGVVHAKKMFGEYAVYCDGKVVALICDDQLFVKPTQAGKAFLGEVEEGYPYPGAKPWFLIAGDGFDDPEWLSELIRISAHELPLPKKKTGKKNR